MALAKKRHIEQAKVRVREKLAAIEQQRDSIMQYVDGQLHQAKDSATSLLQITDRAQFMHQFRPIMQQLEECLNTLFMIQASLPADDTETSGDDASDIGLEDTPTPGGDVTNRTCSISSAGVTGDISRDEHDFSCDTLETNSPVVPASTGECRMSQTAKSTSKLPSDATNVTDTNTDCRAKDAVQTPHVPALAETIPVVARDEPRQTSSPPPDVSDSTVARKVAALGAMMGGWGDRGLKVPTLTLYEDANLDVFVTEVISPSLFWIQPLSSKLEEMMAELIVYHSKLQPTDAGYRLSSQPTPGMLVCACFTRDDNWYRARIISIHVDSSANALWEVDVLYIDYGNRERTTLDRLRPMPENFTKLPCHAFTCALAEIAPPDGSTTWRAEQSIEFAQLVLNGKMLYASFTPPGGDCPLYFVELYRLNPSQTTGMSLMNSVSELLILERHARKATRDVVVQVFTDTVSPDTPPEGALPEVFVHRLQMPEFVLHSVASERRKGSGDGGTVTASAAATKKALAKEKERNRAVRESLRKRKEARGHGEVARKTVPSPGVASASDDACSEVMGSSADRSQDDFSVAAEGTTSMPVHQGAPLKCAASQSVAALKTSSTQKDTTPPQEELVSATWQTWSSPQQPRDTSVAWDTYHRNNTVVVRQGEPSQSDSGPRSDDGSTNKDCGSKRGSQRDEQGPKPCSNRGNHSDKFGQGTDEQKPDTHSNHGNRPDEFGQRRDEQRLETRSNHGNRSDGFGQRRYEQQMPETRSNRGNRSEGYGRSREECRPETSRDSQDYGYNRGNCSGDFRQRRDEPRPETLSNRGNRSDGFGQRRDEPRPETLSNRGNRSDGFGQRRDEPRPETRSNRGNHSEGFGQRREEYRRETWRVSSDRPDDNARNDLEQSRRRARTEYQPHSSEYQSNVTRYSGSSFNRNRSDVKYDSGFGNRSGFDSSESRNGNRRNTSYRSDTNTTLGTNNWCFFDDKAKSSPSKNKPFFEPEKWRDTRGHQDAPRTAQVKAAGTPDEEVWDLEPTSETTAGCRAGHEEKEARTEARDVEPKCEEASPVTYTWGTTSPTNNDPEKKPTQRSPEVKPVDETLTAGTCVTNQDTGPVDTAACPQHEDVNPANVHPPESLSQRQKLRERGLPNRPPKSCGFSTKYEKWMAGSGSTSERGGMQAGDEGSREGEDPVTEVVGVSSDGETGSGRRQEGAGGVEVEGTQGDGGNSEGIVALCELMVKMEMTDEERVVAVTPDVTPEEGRVEITADESGVKRVAPEVTENERGEAGVDESQVKTLTPDVTPEEERVEIIADESGVNSIIPEVTEGEIPTEECQLITVSSEVTPGEETGKETGETPGDETEETLGDETGKTPGEETGETVTPGEETGEETGETPGEETGEETGETPGDETGETPGDETGESVTPGEETGESVTAHLAPEEDRVETITLEEESMGTVTPQITLDEDKVEIAIYESQETAATEEDNVEAVIDGGQEKMTTPPLGVTVEEANVEAVIDGGQEKMTTPPVGVTTEEANVEAVMTDESREEEVTPVEARVEIVISDESGLEAVTTSESGVEPEGVEMEGGVAGCEETVTDEVLEPAVMSNTDSAVVEEEHRGSQEGVEGLEEGRGTGSTRPVGETDSVGDLGETAVPQGDGTGVADGLKEAGPERTRAGEETRDSEEVYDVMSSGRDGRTMESAGVNTEVDEDHPQGEGNGMREVGESGDDGTNDVALQEAAADTVSDADVSRDAGADHSESQTLSLTLLDVSSIDDGTRAEVTTPLLVAPPGETIERVYSPPEIAIAAEDNIAFMMSFIESPSRFWVHLVTENSSDAIDTLMHDLNQYYKTANKVMLWKFFEGDDALNLNNICCAQFSEDNHFYRVEIISKRYEVEEISPESVTESGDAYRPESESRRLAKVKVFYIDFGNSEWLSPKRIYPLPPAFATFAPQAVCCRLVALEPLAPEDSEAGGDGVKDDVQDGTTWSAEATKKFTELTGFDKKLFAYPTQKGDVLRPTTSRPLEVVVVDTSQDQDVWINEELVRLGLAKFSGPVTAVQAQLYSATDETTTKETTGASDLPADWNPLAEDYLSERNSYLVDVDDPGVATVGIKAEDEQTICHFFNSAAGCFKGANCRFEHIRTTDVVTNQRRAVYLRNDLESMLPPPKQDSWVAVELTAVSSPSHFYVTFPFGTRPVVELLREDTGSDEGYEGSNGAFKSELLEQLMENLNEYYNQRGGFRDTDMTIYASGELVVARFSDDGRWYRAKVVDTDPDVSLVKVFYVDFGNAEWVPEAHLAQIQPQFLHLPFQAMECFLPLEAATQDGSWAPEARQCFTELSEGKVLFAHVLSTNSNNVISVELYDTTLEEDVDIGQVLIDTGFAKQPDRTTFKRPLSPTSTHTATNRPRYVPG